VKLSSNQKIPTGQANELTCGAPRYLFEDLIKPPKFYTDICLGPVRMNSMNRPTLFRALAWISVVGFLVITTLLRYQSQPHVYDLSYGVGPVVQGWVERHSPVVNVPLRTLGLAGDTNQSLVFGAHRAPLIPIFIALITAVYNNAFTVALIKLFAGLGLLGYFYRAYSRSLTPAGRFVAELTAFALFAFFPFTSQLVGLEIEEGFIIPMIGAIGLAIFTPRGHLSPRALIFLAFINAALILTKSSMVPISIVFGAMLCYFHRTRRLPTYVASTIVGAFLILSTFHLIYSGRFTPESSWDWWNAYKGNNAQTEIYYVNFRLDAIRIETNRHFANEWEFADDFKRRTLAFMKENPAQELRLFQMKVWTLLTRLDIHSSSKWAGFEATTWFKAIWYGGLLILRLLTGAGLITALGAVVRILYSGHYRDNARFALSAAYLIIFAGSVGPYLVGFGYIRHLMPLLIPMAAYQIRFWDLHGKAEAQSSATPLVPTAKAA
jgi:hypothetical protein